MLSKKKKLKRILRFLGLLTVKEGYLFSKNSLGLVVHPYKTIRKVSREKDRSQQLLILGWPAYVLVVGLVVVVGGRWLIEAPSEWGWLAKTVLLIVSGMVLTLGGYLGYWVKKTKEE